MPRTPDPKSDLMKLFPSAWVGVADQWAIEFIQGEPYVMEIRIADDKGLIGSTTAYIGEPDTLLDLICALVVRYNHVVEGMNEKASRARLNKLNPISGGGEGGGTVQ